MLSHHLLAASYMGDLSTQSQIVALIERSQNILLCTHRKPDGDAVGSIMALYKALKLLDKKVTASCESELPESFSFLPEVEHITRDVNANQDFVVTLDCADAEVDRLKYHLEDNKIHIIITPKRGRFLKENVSVQKNVESYDLIITVDVADIPQLGRLYQENAELFASTPVVNIDHHISNTQFGKINVIENKASSTAEILFGLIRALEAHFHKPLLTAEVSTFLLSGITTDTGSFQNANTTPRSMEIAAELIDAGAQQQDIIKYLFRTKKMATLKLWGRILNKIEVDEVHRLVWSSVTKQDLVSTGAQMDEAGNIIDELLVHAPEADIVVLFKEEPDMINASFRSKNAQTNVMEIAQHFGGGGHVQAAGAKFPGKTLAEMMNQIVAYLQQVQRQRLGLASEVGDEQVGQEQKKVTQVLDGYIGPEIPEKQSLEAKAKAGLPDSPAGQPVDIQIAKPAPLPSAPKQPDIHTTARQAIEAEQSHSRLPAGAGDNNGFTPSKAAATQERPKPIPEKRFTDELPGFLKPVPPVPIQPATPPVPPAPSSPAPAKPESGVTVKPAAISGDGSTGTSAGEAQAGQGQQGQQTTGQQGQQTAGQQGTSSAQPLSPNPAPAPEPKKDPFAIGDDGLTDIERALGGL
ncbi:MAG: bifunctional oligoribonuclease/PAP phosphatase NrnA [bacterium]|nr:bifunctional oligoribonuclease/PAP phosphatase NrnA [bacterium]